MTPIIAKARSLIQEIVLSDLLSVFVWQPLAVYADMCPPRTAHTAVERLTPAGDALRVRCALPPHLRHPSGDFVNKKENLYNRRSARALHHGRLMETPKSSRRQFCTQVVSIVSVASLLEGCGGSPTSADNVPAVSRVSGTLGTGNTIQLTIDASSPLSSVGSAALVQTSSGNLLVAHTAQDTFTALSSICTHDVCTITGYQSGTFVCPCHGSEYNTSGRVIRGPASASLRQYGTQFSNNVLTINLV